MVVSSGMEAALPRMRAPMRAGVGHNWPGSEAARSDGQPQEGGTMSGQQTVAVLGAGGTMGFPMAANLARAGFSVRAWNRSRDKAEPLSKDGVRVCGTPAEAAEGASVILTMLADTDAVLAAVDGPDGAVAAAKEAGPAPGAATGPADGIIWLQM